MYKAKDYSYLLGMPGFSTKYLKLHFTLYQGYVKNTNKMLKQFEEMDQENICFSEIKRRFGWEFAGMRLHEYYFENLGGQPLVKAHSKLIEWLCNCFGSVEKWQEKFTAVGLTRGIGWVILYRDNHTGMLTNCWIEQHHAGHLPGCQPILVMDVWEHAYLCEYGLDRKAYIEAFIQNINWNVVMQRFQHMGI